MKNALLILFVFVMSNSYSQENVARQDDAVYLSLFSNLSFCQEMPIFYHTSLSNLEKADLKKTDLKVWLKRGQVSGWREFFNSTNLETLTETEFKSPIGSHPIVKKMFVVNEKHEPKPVIQLSPVIYSSDKKLALVSVFDWSGPDSSTNTVYLMEFKEGKWRVVKFLLLSIS